MFKRFSCGNVKKIRTYKVRILIAWWNTTRSKRTPHRLFPVSYTHLDVYKRQIYELDNTDFSTITHEGARAAGAPSLEEYNAQVRNGIDVYKRQVYEWALANRLRLHHWFFSTDLTFYVKGGRISKASGWFGTVLNLSLIHI